MDMTMQLVRTGKGQEEIFNQGHSLRPRYRQLLFSIGNGISFGELCRQHPKCVEMESMVNELLQSGFVQALRNMGAVSPAPATNVSNVIAKAEESSPSRPTAVRVNSLLEAQTFVLEFMVKRVGGKSPAYKQMSEVSDVVAFKAAFPMCRKVIAAVASPREAAEMEAEVTQRLGA